ncbi:MAG: LON peptidase substrate-binding domain-containing protein [Deinococcota bacterium]|nr:LON peptidase substrate-binding domain-containing protein [Deinococcota bacterium]
MADLPLFPLPETVVFPGMTLPLFIFEERYKAMVKDCLETQNQRLVIVLARPSARLNDGIVATYEVGAYVDLMSVAENADGTFNILVHGQGRCRVKGIDAVSHPYYSVEEAAYPLERGDPNGEQVAAWDALDVFRDYAKQTFAFDAMSQIGKAMPSDAVHQASFICANLRVPAASRQVLLEAPSLIARFGLAQKLMQEQLTRHAAELTVPGRAERDN